MTAAYAEAYGAWSRRVASDGNNRGSPVKDVALVLARQAFDERCKGRDLAQFLVAPVQRVPRYRLLLEALVLRTNEDHADRNDLDEALTLVRDACAKIDSILGENAVRNEMQLLKSQIHDPTNQLSSLVAHRLVRTGDARKLSTSKIETLTFWLTDRALFSCDRPPATTHPYRLRFYAPLTRCVVEAAPFATLSNRCDRAASEQLELAAAEDPRLARIQDALRAERAGTRCLVVRSPRKSFYLELSTEQQAQAWLDDVAAVQKTPPSLDFAPVASDAPRKRGWLSPRRSRPDVYDFSPRGSEASALSPRGSYDLGSDDDAPSWAPASPPPPPRPRSLLAAARSASASRPPPPLPPRSSSVVVEPPPAPPSPPAPPDQPPLTTDSASCFVACAPAPAPPERPAAPESSPEPATVGVFGRRAGAPAPVPPAARDTMFTSIAERLRRFEGLGR